MLLERSASQADVQELLCSSGLTTAHPVSCVVEALSGLGEKEDGVSVKMKLWDMFFMGSYTSFLSLLISRLVIIT